MSSLSKQELIDRWKQPENQDLRSEVINCFKNNEDLDSIPSLGKYDGRLDLRGFSFSKSNVKISNATLKDIDFSYGHFGITIKNSMLENIILDKAEGFQVFDEGSTFRNCSFINADWRNCTLGYSGARYESCNFQKANLLGTLYYQGYFIDCDFSNAKLTGTDFQSSHFINCKFKGKLKNIWFRGKTERSSIKNVDFSEAVLWNVVFANVIDLSTVTIPKDGNHVFFPRWDYTLKVAKQEVKEKWKAPFKDRAWTLVDFILSDYSSTMNIVNLKFIESLLGIKKFTDPKQEQKFTKACIDLLLRHK
ncbi:MAG TPA: pentapeptide repeat-containing protein [Alphaproteobacteria bacterium]|jgi:uncharacterized protein YjbI with pentapeptide repeats|nr:pentapeptide repeat-containing protein [Alphaproteobacteria bacterium]